MQWRLLKSLAVLMMLSSSSTAVYAGVAEDAKSFRDITLTPRRVIENESRGELREDAKEVAEVLGVSDMVARLRQAKGNPNPSREVQTMRLLVLWRIFTASEEVRHVVAECGFDLAQAHIALDGLNAKKQMVSNTLTTANFMQGGTMGIMKQSLNYYRQNHVIVQEIGITTFGVGTGLAAINQLIGPAWTRKIDSRPTMLSHFFNENYVPKDFEVSYLWKFFNKPCPGYSNNLTRRQVLIKHWKDFGNLDTENKRLVDRVAASAPEGEREGVKILGKRIALLNDLRSHFEEFDASLYELHKAITN